MTDATKLYTHYKDVALKHFDALRMMCQKLKKTSNAGCKEYKNLLYEAYYISGYILEGASVYVIFKHIDWKDSIEIPVGKGHRERELTDTNNFNSASSALPTTDAKVLFANLHNHNIKEYTNSTFTGCSSVPFFRGDQDTDASIPTLLKVWDANKRYFLEQDFIDAGLSITADNIEEIIEFCRKHIIRYIKTI